MRLVGAVVAEGFRVILVISSDIVQGELAQLDLLLGEQKGHLEIAVQVTSTRH